MQPSTRLTSLFWQFGPLADGGDAESIETVQARIHDRSLFDYLEERYEDDVDLSLYGEDDRDALLDLFEGFTGIDHERKFGIKRNGLLLLLAYANEGIQQEFRRIEESR